MHKGKHWLNSKPPKQQGPKLILVALTINTVSNLKSCCYLRIIVNVAHQIVVLPKSLQLSDLVTTTKYVVAYILYSLYFNFHLAESKYY